MKIGPPTDNPARVGTSAQPVPQASTQSGSSTAAAPAGKRAPASGVAVTVSSLARTLEAAAGASDIDLEKVESVKAAIEQGTYKVNAEAIADKLLANAQEMLNRNRE